MATASHHAQNESATEVSVDGDLASSMENSDQPSVEVRNTPKRLIIIEPVLAMFLAAYIPNATLISQFVYVIVSSRNNLTELQDKTGQYFNGTDATDICKSSQFEYIHQLQNYVQSKAAELNMILSVSTALPAVLAVLYLGAISDKVGRKIPLILPIVGQLVKCTIFILTLYFRLPLKLLIVGSVIEGLFGGLTTIMMSGMAYMTDICEKTNRTFRITAIEVTCGISAALAQILMGFAITYLGFLYPFYIIMGVHSFNLLYVIFFVPEMRFAKTKKIISPKHILRTFRLYSVNDGNGRRLKRILCLVALAFCSMTVSGRWDPLTLYQLNSPLCFTSILIGINSAWIALCSQGGQIALVSLLYSRLHDVGLAILGCISGIAYFILVALAKSTAMMFAIAPVGLASFVPVAMLRGIQSKMVSPEEQGALFASTAAIETLCGLAGAVIFNPIYSATLDFMTGFVFIVMAIFLFIGLCLTVCYAILTRNLSRDGEPLKNEDSEEEGSEDGPDITGPVNPASGSSSINN